MASPGPGPLPDADGLCVPSGTAAAPPPLSAGSGPAERRGQTPVSPLLVSPRQTGGTQGRAPLGLRAAGCPVTPCSAPPRRCSVQECSPAALANRCCPLQVPGRWMCRAVAVPAEPWPCRAAGDDSRSRLCPVSLSSAVAPSLGSAVSPGKGCVPGGMRSQPVLGPAEQVRSGSSVPPECRCFCLFSCRCSCLWQSWHGNAVEAGSVAVGRGQRWGVEREGPWGGNVVWPWICEL